MSLLTPNVSTVVSESTSKFSILILLNIEELLSGKD